jgi:hypothetical protein
MAGFDPALQHKLFCQYQDGRGRKNTTITIISASYKVARSNPRTYVAVGQLLWLKAIELREG